MGEHRSSHNLVYRTFEASDDPASEDHTALIRGLFTTSFLADDFLADNAYFGARRLLLSSASSKTAYGTAFCLARRRGTPGAPAVVGLTSAANMDFTRSLGCYDTVRSYAEVTALDPGEPTVYVDFAGNAALRRAVHEHFGSALVYSSSIGGTHWSDLASGSGLPGPRPVLFFAPAQIRKREAPPPDGWGRDALQQRLGAAWAAFVARVNQADDPWLRIVSGRGATALQNAYTALLAGQADARTGQMLTLQP